MITPPHRLPPERYNGVNDVMQQRELDPSRRV